MAGRGDRGPLSPASHPLPCPPTSDPVSRTVFPPFPPRAVAPCHNPETQPQTPGRWKKSPPACSAKKQQKRGSGVSSAGPGKNGKIVMRGQSGKRSPARLTGGLSGFVGKVGLRFRGPGPTPGAPQKTPFCTSFSAGAPGVLSAKIFTRMREKSEKMGPAWENARVPGKKNVSGSARRGDPGVSPGPPKIFRCRQKIEKMPKNVKCHFGRLRNCSRIFFIGVVTSAHLRAWYSG